MKFLACIGAFWAVFQVSAQSVQTVLPKRQVNIGEPFVVSLSVTDATAAQVRLPNLKGRGAEVVGVQDKDTTDNKGNRIARRNYRLMLLEPGAFTLPPLAIEITQNGVKRNLLSDSVTVYVELLPVAQPDLRPEPPVAVAYDRSEWTPYVIAVAVLVFSVAFWAIFRHFRHNSKSTVTRNPTRTILKELRLFSNRQLQEDPKENAARLDRLLRDYLTYRFGISARHLSVEEISKELREKGATEKDAKSVENLLKRLQVARYSPDTNEDSVELPKEIERMVSAK